MMASAHYAYIERTYGSTFKVGLRVRHTVTGKSGMVTREDLSQAHYVQVRFDDRKFSVPCHPKELVIEAHEAAKGGAA
ncbi:MAG: hypothetical protein ACRDBL_09195 [Rhabdaerophilum sp.]